MGKKKLIEEVKSWRFVLKQTDPETYQNVTLEYDDVLELDEDEKFLYIVRKESVLAISISEIVMFEAFRKDVAE